MDGNLSNEGAIINMDEMITVNLTKIERVRNTIGWFLKGVLGVLFGAFAGLTVIAVIFNADSLVVFVAISTMASFGSLILYNDIRLTIHDTIRALATILIFIMMLFAIVPVVGYKLDPDGLSGASKLWWSVSRTGGVFFGMITSLLIVDAIIDFIRWLRKRKEIN